jgi:DNA-binding NarL/FixJ family response regulator
VGRGSLDGLRVLIMGTVPLHAESLCTALHARGVEASWDAVPWADPATWGKQVQRVADADDAPLVLLDVDIAADAWPELGAVEQAVSVLKREGRRVLLLTSDVGSAAVAVGVAGGAATIIDGYGSVEQVHETLRQVGLDRPGLSPEWRHRLVERARREKDAHRERLATRRGLGERLDRLSGRERQVLEMLVTGQRAQAIADSLTVSLPTVRAQIRGILIKLEVTSQLEAVAVLNVYRTVDAVPG